MSDRQFLAVLFGLGCVTLVVLLAIGASTSIENTRLKTEATVSRAQEHTKRTETRQNNLDFLGMLRGWKDK